MAAGLRLAVEVGVPGGATINFMVGNRLPGGLV